MQMNILSQIKKIFHENSFSLHFSSVRSLHPHLDIFQPRQPLEVITCIIYPQNRFECLLPRFNLLLHNLLCINLFPKLQRFKQTAVFCENFKTIISISFSRSDKGLDDDDDDGDEDDVMPTQQRQDVQSRQLSDGSNPLLLIFNAVTNVLTRSAASAAQRTGAQLIGLDRNEELKGDNGGVDDDESVTETAYGNYRIRD
jgi:hypothetical protein